MAAIMKFMRIFIPLLILSATLSFAGNVAIFTKTIPNGTVGTTYSATILATGGCKPYAWKTTGTIPAGVTSSVSKDSSSLILSGTPTTAATYNFSATVTGCGKKTSTVAYAVTIQSLANHVVALSWNASTSQNIAGYNVYRATTATGPWGKVNASLIGGLVYSDSSVANGTTYFYTATAVDITQVESAMSSPPITAVIP